MRREGTPRRVVTGHDGDGKSVVVLDDQPAAQSLGSGEARRDLTEIWATASPAVAEPGASEFRIVELPPGSRREMHRTDTVDYGIVLTGEIHLVLEQQETKLRTGDVVVQRGTNHSWHNRSERAARMAFVNLSGQVSDPARCPDV